MSTDKLINLEEMYTDDFFKYYNSHKYGHRKRIICPFLIELLHPKSVIEVGCSTGGWVQGFLERGVDAYGIDGAPKALKHKVIPDDKFFLHDLRKPYPITRKYDLCICTETAEHIEEQFSDILLDTVCGLSDTIWWAAALPNEPHPMGHVNLQPTQYWIDRITKRGFHRREDWDAVWRKAIYPIRWKKGIHHMILHNIFFEKNK